MRKWILFLRFQCWSDNKSCFIWAPKLTHKRMTTNTRMRKQRFKQATTFMLKRFSFSAHTLRRRAFVSMQIQCQRRRFTLIIRSFFLQRKCQAPKAPYFLSIWTRVESHNARDSPHLNTIKVALYQKVVRSFLVDDRLFSPFSIQYTLKQEVQ